MHSSGLRNSLGATLIALCVFLSACRAGLPYDPGIEKFNTKHFLNGMHASPDECGAYRDRLWVVVEGEGYCIRYFGSKLQKPTDILQVYLSGDLPAGDIWALYDEYTPRTLTAFANGIAETGKIPTIVVARPGTFGSSGDHKKVSRWTGHEARILNAVLNEMKSIYGIKKFGLVGQSGGGHVAAYLLTLRTDIKCATLASTPLSLEHYRKNWKSVIDFSDFAEYFWDPLIHWPDVKRDEKRRILVMNDKKDQVVPYEGARAYVQRGMARGHNVFFIDAKAKDKNFHGLGVWGLAVNTFCVKGLSDQDIQEKIQMVNGNS
ncbi:hypothetical protein L2D14_10520 [Thalassospiraceae bacterium LMO-JJ14]|nr:hypothetical protein L2D14_10520 [Thalassospiraceae bacterium LMO-JJ14]